MQEVWLPVVGWEGLYEVSDWGKVRSLDRVVLCHDGRQLRICGRLLRTCPDRKGYLTAKLWKENRERTCRVHTLVAEAFLGPRPAGMDVCHGSADRTDNRAANLRYGTRAANMADKLRDGTAQRGEKGNGAKMTEVEVLAIRISRESGVAMAHRYGISTAQVSRIRTGKRWAWLDAA